VAYYFDRKKSLHYNPTTPLLDGLKETWSWYVKNQDEYLNKMNYFKDQENGSKENKT